MNGLPGIDTEDIIIVSCMLGVLFIGVLAFDRYLVRKYKRGEGK